MTMYFAIASVEICGVPAKKRRYIVAICAAVAALVITGVFLCLVGRDHRARRAIRDSESSMPVGSRVPRMPLSAPPDDDMHVWNLARHRASVEHVLTKTALSAQSRQIYRELLATGDNCAEVARRMNLPAATVRQVKSRVSRMIAAFEKTIG